MADISFACPNCSQVLEAPEDMAGQVVECPSCQQQISVPGPEVESESDDEAPAAEAEEGDEAEASGAKCPSCGTAMEPDAVLCMNCGFHTKLGKKINTSLG